MILFILMGKIKIKTNNNKIKRIKNRVMLIKKIKHQTIINNNQINLNKSKVKVMMIKVKIK